MDMELNYSIVESSVQGSIRLAFDFSLLNPNITSTTNNPPQLIKSGQLINISAIANGSTIIQPIYRGFIRRVKPHRNEEGTFIILIIDQVLGQLTLLNSNISYNDATKTYNTLFTNINGNQIQLMPFLNQLATGSLISDVPIQNENPSTQSIQWFMFINGTANPLPNTLWATCLVNEMRDAVLREMLYAYNRILWQAPDGTIYIQPLFLDDKANEMWNLDLQENLNNNWLSWEISDNAGEQINRIDCQFAALLPFDQYDAPGSNPNYNLNGNNIFASSFPNSTYYPRMAALQNSGLYNTAILTQKALDPSVIVDAALSNALKNAFGQNNITTLSQYTKITTSPNSKNSNIIPQLYASNEMAINNIKAYMLSVIYDYNVMIDAPNDSGVNSFLDLPLAKVVNIKSYGLLDYDQMLCFSCSLTVNNEGSNVRVNYCPLESITGFWYNVGNGS